MSLITTQIEKTTEAQQGLYFLHCLDKDNTTYNVSINLHLCGHLNFGALEKSIATLVDRHESLRTSFRLDKDQLVQLIHPAAQSIPPAPENSNQDSGYLKCYPLADGLSGVDQQQLLNREINRPFDLNRAPLFRCAVFSSGDNTESSEHLFNFTVHHNTFDHQSKAIFTDELTGLYNHYAHGANIELNSDVPQFTDYVNARQERQLQSNSLSLIHI